MSRLIEAYNFIMREYEYIYQRFPLWLALVLASLVLVGVIVALANRNKHNFLVWIVPVILFPVFSTFVLVAWAIVLLVIKRKKGFIPGKYFLNKGRVVFITLITVAAGIYVVYFSNGMLPFINEAFVTGIAVLCIFLTYFGTLRRYSHDARFMQICRLDGNMSKNDYRKNDYIYCAFSSDLLPSVDDVVKIKDKFFESYAPHFDGKWQYVLDGVNERFVFDTYTEEEYLQRFDAENACYIGKGIVKITAYKWFWSDTYGVVVRNNNADQLDISENRGYEEYDGTSVQEVVLYRCQQSPKRLIIETLELTAAVFVFVTPLGAWLHSMSITGLTSLLELIF